MTDRVRMILTGRMPEKFANEALKRGIVFHGMTRIAARKLLLETDTANAKDIRALAEEYGLEWTIEERTGWRETAEKLLERNTLFFSLALCCALIVLFSCHVWQIELISPDGSLSGETLKGVEDALENMGVEAGMFRKDVDAQMISAQLMGRFPEMTYAGVRLHGVRLTVDVKSGSAVPEIYDADKARDLYAARDAVIVLVEPLDGKACVKAGDTVMAGQTVIRGEEKISSDETKRIRARGKVMGRVWFAGEETGTLTENVRTATGRERSRSALRLFSWRFELTRADDFACQDTQTERLPVGGLFLPMVIERTILREMSESEKMRDEGALEEELTQAALQKARSRLPEGAQETAFWTEKTIMNGQMRVEAIIEAEMDIAVDFYGRSGQE